MSVAVLLLYSSFLLLSITNLFLTIMFVVPPAYYAHLTAFRARYYMEGIISDGGSSSSDARATREGSSAVRSVPATTANVKDVMFYC